jgi:glutathione synthase/RimK-type ligase-like ATP-grasp enzyme
VFPPFAIDTAVMPRVALATCAALPQLDHEDTPLVPALRRAGIDGVPLVWTDPAVDWSAHDLVIVRTTWDYPNKIAAFLAWTERVAAARPLWNPAPILRWNTDKRYLRELSAWGVPIVPTRWFERGSAADLPELLADERWANAVLKPVVSAGARRTRLVAPDTVGAGARFLSEQLTQRAMMVQPYVAEVSTVGELSLLYFNGRFSHAVRKIPAAGDFRVQTEHGGRVLAVQPTVAELAAGQRVLDALAEDTLYARVDLLPTSDGVLRLLELEVTEPSMFLRWDADAPDRFAAAIRERLG